MNLEELTAEEPLVSGKGSLSEQAYDRIKRAIVTHELASGERVSEASVTSDFALSKAAVRSALAKLSAERLIISSGPKTQIVAPLNMHCVRSVFHLRNLLEPDAASEAVSRIDVGKLQKLNERCAVPFRVGDKESEYEFLAANRDFHMFIARASGTPLQIQFIERLQDLSMRILWVSLQIENRPSIWHHGHEDIIDAFVKGDRAEVAKRALTHLESGQRLIYEVITSRDDFKTIEVSPKQ